MRSCTGNLKRDFIIMCQIKMTNLSGDEQGVQKQAFPITSGYSNLQKYTRNKSI